MKYYIIVLLIFPILSYSQRDNTWILGYGYPDASMMYGGMKVTFNTGNPDITLLSDTTRFLDCNTSISDTSGNLLFYTNGLDIRNKNNQIMENGDSLNYGYLWNIWKNAGMPLQQGALILPIPEHNNQYYLIHNTLSEYEMGNVYPTEVMYSTVDMSFNQGLGKVITKNQSLSIQDKAEVALSACRHGNGRDWWLLFPNRNTNCYERFLLTSNGFENKGQACVDGINFDAVGQAVYSHDGTKYARIQDNAVYIMDFDRCNGLYSSVISDYLATQGCGGLCFSPNSQYLYLFRCDSVFQYDMLASNITSSRLFITKTDNVLDPYSPTQFQYAQLASNNKIYVLAKGGQSLSVIHNPDFLGLACDFEIRGLHLPHLNNTIPNHPNYHLGAIACGVNAEESIAVQANIYPNPAQDVLHIEMPISAQNTTFSLYDLSGKEVLKQSFLGNNTYIRLGRLAKGAYFYRLSFNNKQEYGKLLVE